MRQRDTVRRDTIRLLLSAIGYEEKAKRTDALEDDAVTHYRWGTLWLEEGNTAEARQHFIRAVQLDSDFTDALYALAKLAMEADEPTTALRYLQRLSHLVPDRADILILIGQLYLQQKQYASAALHLWEARDLEPDVADVEFLLLQVYQHMLQRQQEVVNRLTPTPKPALAGGVPEPAATRR